MLEFYGYQRYKCIWPHSFIGSPEYLIYAYNCEKFPIFCWRMPFPSCIVCHMTPWLTHLTNRVIGLKNFNNFRCADQLTILEEEEKSTILKCIIIKKGGLLWWVRSVKRYNGFQLKLSNGQEMKRKNIRFERFNNYYKFTTNCIISYFLRKGLRRVNLRSDICWKQ